MSLNSYAAIQAELADILARADLTNQIQDAITLFEAEASYELFRTRGTETRTILQPSSQNTYSVSNLADNGTGGIRVTYPGSISPVLKTNDVIAISGTNQVDNSWSITIIDATHFDLQNSSIASLTGDFTSDFSADFSEDFTAGTATFTNEPGLCPLPSDYLGWRRLTYTGVPTMDLEYVSPDIFEDEFPTFTPLVATDIPRVFTVEVGYVKIRPVASTPLDFLYWAKTPALAGNFNWLITNRPDAYIAGCLSILYGLWVKDYQKAQLYKSVKDEIFSQIKVQRFREFSGLHIRIDRSSFGATP